MHSSRSIDVQHIRDIPLFQSCTDKQLRRIAGLTSTCEVAAGAVLCQEGGFGRQSFIVIDGEADVIIGAERVTTLGPGSIIGEMAVLDGDRRTATVTARTAMTVLVLTPQELETLLAEVPQVAKGVLATVSGRLRLANRRPFGPVWSADDAGAGDPRQLVSGCEVAG